MRIISSGYLIQPLAGEVMVKHEWGVSSIIRSAVDIFCTTSFLRIEDGIPTFRGKKLLRSGLQMPPIFSVLRRPSSPAIG